MFNHAHSYTSLVMAALFNPCFVFFLDYSQQAEGIPHDAAASRHYRKLLNLRGSK
jgi:hypothetical protein